MWARGNSELLQDANNFDVLIDGGVAGAGPTVVAYLRQAEIDSLDVLVASHSDADHIGGLIDVLEATDIPINAVVLNGYSATSATWNNFIKAIAARGLTPTVVSFPADFQWGEMSVHVLNPERARGWSTPILMIRPSSYAWIMGRSISSSPEISPRRSRVR